MVVWTASLPLDVLHLVGLVAQPPDLCSMLQVNKALNKTLTPILYSRIQLDAWDPILKYTATLDSQSRKRSFGRVLAKYVQSLTIKRPLSRKPSYACGIGDALFKALPLMVNLKHFSSEIGLSPCSSNIFYLLATGTCASLQSMELQVIGEVPKALEGRHPDDIESSTLQVPTNLRRLVLEVPIDSAAQRAFVRHLLRTCAPTLRTLSLAIDGRYLRDIWEHFLPSDAEFAHLEDLAIESEALSHPSLRPAVNIHSLKLLDNRGTGLLVSSTILSNLRSLSCPAKMLSAFLPANADRRRPIATVCLGKASYRSRSDDDSSNRSEPARWRAVFASLQHLRYSAVPVTSLTVDVIGIELAGVQAAQPYLAPLEYLDIVLHKAYEPDALDRLARELLTHPPRLHTLLISQAPKPTAHVPLFGEEELELGLDGAMRLSRAMILEFEDGSWKLRRFALSAKIEWHKKDDKWYWVADPRQYGELCGSFDDHDYQNSEWEDEAVEESEGEGCGSSKDEGTVCVDSGYEDGSVGPDDGYEGEAPEETRDRPLDTWVETATGRSTSM